LDGTGVAAADRDHIEMLGKIHANTMGYKRLILQYFLMSRRVPGRQVIMRVD